LSVTRLRYAENKILFVLETLGDPRHIVLYVVSIPLWRGAFDAAFAELLWPFVTIVIIITIRLLLYIKKLLV